MFKSPNIQGSPFLVENTESDIFDGLTALFNNYWYTKDTLSGWVGPAAYVYNLSAVDLPALDPPLRGYRRPADYEVQFADQIVDTSIIGPFPLDVATPVKFRVFNVTENRYVKFLFTPGIAPGGGNTITPLAEVILMEENPRARVVPDVVVVLHQ